MHLFAFNKRLRKAAKTKKYTQTSAAKINMAKQAKRTRKLHASNVAEKSMKREGEVSAVGEVRSLLSGLLVSFVLSKKKRNRAARGHLSGSESFKLLSQFQELIEYISLSYIFLR